MDANSLICKIFLEICDLSIIPLRIKLDKERSRFFDEDQFYCMTQNQKQFERMAR